MVVMLLFALLLQSALLCIGFLVAEHINEPHKAGTPSAQGVHDGFFWSWWTDGQANATYSNGPHGQFSIEWGTGGNLIGGKGWNPASRNRTVEYIATEFDITGNSYLAIYGWMQNPRVEYYIIENYGTYNPANSFTSRGTHVVDGSSYNIGFTYRINWLPIGGQNTVYTFFSVRNQRRLSGRVDTRSHFRAWEAAGMKLGANMEYQIVACEGYFSTGRCTVEVNEDNE